MQLHCCMRQLHCCMRRLTCSICLARQAAAAAAAAACCSARSADLKPPSACPPCFLPAGAAGADDQREAAADQRVRERQGDTQPAGAARCWKGIKGYAGQAPGCCGCTSLRCFCAAVPSTAAVPRLHRPSGAERAPVCLTAPTLLSSVLASLPTVRRSCPRCPACWASPSKRTPARSEAAGAGRGSGAPHISTAAARILHPCLA